jgi:hypothetical protein
VLDFPMKYIIGHARSALRFRVGNCEEVASTAYVMLTLGKKSAGELVDTGDEAVPVELVYIKTSDGAAHFFVIMNRTMGEEGSIEESKSGWLQDDDTIICDPWISDIGLGGRITDNAPAMRELRSWIEDATICVRATTNLASGSAFIKDADEPKFYI